MYHFSCIHINVAVTRYSDSGVELVTWRFTNFNLLAKENYLSIQGNTVLDIVVEICKLFSELPVVGEGVSKIGIPLAPNIAEASGRLR